MSTTQNIIALESQIPTKVSDLENDAGYITGDSGTQADWNETDQTAMGYIKNKPPIPAAVTVDATLTTSGAAADAKAVGDALRGGFTEWEFSDGGSYDLSGPYEGSDDKWYYVLGGGSNVYSEEKFDTEAEALAALSLVFDYFGGITAARHAFPPTKTSQLTNDGDGTNAFVKTNDTRLSDARTPTAHHATHAANGSDPLAPADIGAAAASDLPYRLVEPGKWEYEPSVQLTNFEVTSSPVYNSSDADPWSVTYYSEETGNETLQAPGGADALSLDFGTFTATRPSLPGHLCDRAINHVSLAEGAPLQLPMRVAGKVRDLLVRMDIDSAFSGSVDWVAPTGEQIVKETEDGTEPFPETIDADMTVLFSWTETLYDDSTTPPTSHWALSMKPLIPVTQGGS